MVSTPTAPRNFVNHAMTVAIDASSVSTGGTLTHLINFLKASNEFTQFFSKIVVWTSSATAEKLPMFPWLFVRTPSALNRGLAGRLYWQHNTLAKSAHAESCGVLLSLGGVYTGSYRPYVAMNQNALPYTPNAMKLYGPHTELVRLLALRMLTKITLQKANGIIFLSEYSKALHKKALSLNEATLIDVIPHGCDHVSPRTLTHSRSENVVLYVSHTHAYKNHLSVAHAVAKARELGANITVRFVGELVRPWSRRLAETLSALDPTSSWSTLTGDLSQDALEKEYENADIAVFASSCESMPLVLLEKMRKGLPIACSQEGPMPEILKTTGCYFDPKDTLSITSVLLRLAANPRLRADLGTAAFAESSTYSWNATALQTFKVLSAAWSTYQ